MEEYKLIEKIGVGSYGIVHRASYNSQMVAAKVFRAFVVSPMSREIISELEQLKTLDHKCIVKYFDIHFNCQRQLVIIMELCSQNLTSFLKQYSEDPLPYSMEVKINFCIAKAVEFLHQKCIIHGNLTSNNVLMDAENKVKVSDYGMKILQNQMTEMFVNDDYMPPEASPIFTPHYDVFACGVLQVQVMTRQLPNPQPIVEGENIPLEKDRRAEHLNMIEDAHPLKQISLCCLEDEKSGRPTSSELVHMLKNVKEQRFNEIRVVTQPQLQPQPKVSPQPLPLQPAGPIRIDLLLVGSNGVGKTNLAKVYKREIPGSYPPTLLGEFCVSCFRGILPGHGICCE